MHIECRWNWFAYLPCFGHTSSKREQAILDGNWPSCKNLEGMSETKLNNSFNFAFSLYLLIIIKILMNIIFFPEKKRKKITVTSTNLDWRYTDLLSLENSKNLLELVGCLVNLQYHEEQNKSPAKKRRLIL